VIHYYCANVLRVLMILYIRSCQSWYSKARVKDYGSAGSYTQYGHTILGTFNQARVSSRSNKRFDHAFVCS
jgi:hypothetical protein